MPPPFRIHCKNVRIIVECTEFEIQKTASPMEQQMIFSRYKNANTLKGMIGITPNGAISFISELYSGSISDKELFIRSKLMDRLERNDVVMADKGFLISKELEEIGECRIHSQCRQIFGTFSAAYSSWQKDRFVKNYFLDFSSLPETDKNPVGRSQNSYLQLTF
ncbi:uncharacterized protein TNCT_556991 [Trichonephila clavata]|uniref:DDE Tnp4 domain-containing protein n=1 Tax=Trichonephila clavata TaxID=2740835 RepID=A0A8X6G4V1_TRICU|nr:uncharacterized protein TNCT_556991 [Trichonephila clavata]